jgi:hypothetical protein
MRRTLFAFAIIGLVGCSDSFAVAVGEPPIDGTVADVDLPSDDAVVPPGPDDTGGPPVPSDGGDEPDATISDGALPDGTNTDGGAPDSVIADGPADGPLDTQTPPDAPPDVPPTGPSCSEIQTQYTGLLPKTKPCSVDADCRALVQGANFCCQTYVNPNTSAWPQLEQLRKMWTDSRCSSGSCRLCIAITSAKCQLDTNTNAYRCVDQSGIIAPEPF